MELGTSKGCIYHPAQIEFSNKQALINFLWEYTQWVNSRQYVTEQSIELYLEGLEGERE